MIKKILLVASIVMSFNASAINANSNGEWIRLGVPSYVHIGTDGRFFLNGTSQGSCANKRPTYFRMDMNKPHFEKTYSWLLMMSTQSKPIDCVVDSGCGSSEVWVSYCRGPLK
ncbi:hypothetical protein VIBNISOn1_30134 [Vibrio nigripulchritudo SOn1]|uniref:Uncharacterized protein n=1 Tax=Vibrio nigripulchritudo SOn1 TaxID=1238450 RepID=A0AAV2VSA6_9VIBR|nr:hypothetical protein [Vibrio nigripulchritudo]CCO47440.1 hypothetical protein VIBNISOn1_30134 [Vibrio nigripulchritudo SOn1]